MKQLKMVHLPNELDGQRKRISCIESAVTYKLSQIRKNIQRMFTEHVGWVPTIKCSDDVIKDRDPDEVYRRPDGVFENHYIQGTGVSIIISMSLHVIGAYNMI